MLKILGGEARGRILKTHKTEDLSIRPMLGRMKKSLFDIILPWLPGCVFLDLFAGTGAVGLEAVSRGAKKAVFVEMSSRSLELIKANVAMLKMQDRAEVHRADVTKDLKWLNRKFDVIFLGPPYKDEHKRPLALTTVTLRNVLNSDLMTPDTIMIAQYHDKEPVSIPDGLEEYRTEKYGDTIVSFYRLAGPGAEGDDGQN